MHDSELALLPHEYTRSNSNGLDVLHYLTSCGPHVSVGPSFPVHKITPGGGWNNRQFAGKVDR
jgi:hypothetical protein